MKLLRWYKNNSLFVKLLLIPPFLLFLFVSLITVAAIYDLATVSKEERAAYSEELDAKREAEKLAKVEEEEKGNKKKPNKKSKKK